jgi:hypothetical protein
LLLKKCFDKIVVKENIRMNLVYIDESGNTGLNLKDSQQPIFILAAMILPELKWFALESPFLDIAREYFGDPLPEKFEVQAKDLKPGRGIFTNLSFEQHYLFVTECCNCS